MKCPSCIPLDLSLTYEIIACIEMPRMLSEPRRGESDRFIVRPCSIGAEPK